MKSKEIIYKKNICPLCGRKGKYLFKQRDKKTNLPGIFYVFHCIFCKIDYIEPPKNLSEFYTNDYFSDFADKKNILFKIKSHIISNYYLSTGLIKKKIYGFFLSFIAALPKSKGRIMDVGCGSGDILFLLKQVKFDVYGLDISKHAVNLAHKNGLRNVIVGMEDKVETFPDNYFDCIRGSHVVEHMPDPIRFINSCHKKLAKNGTLILATPNIYSLNRFIFGRHTKCYSDIPRHIILFSNKAIVRIFKEAGFKDIKITYRTAFSDFYEGLFCFFDNKFNISNTNIGKILHKNIFINFIFLPIDLVAMLFKKGETMTIIAKK